MAAIADTVRESSLEVDSGRKTPCRTGESNLRGAVAGSMLYQLSYIPTPRYHHTLALIVSSGGGGVNHVVSCGDRDPRRWGKIETNLTVS